MMNIMIGFVILITGMLLESCLCETKEMKNEPKIIVVKNVLTEEKVGK